MDENYFEIVLKNLGLLLLGVIITLASYFSALPGETYVICSGMIVVSIFNLIVLLFHYLQYELCVFEYLKRKKIHKFICGVFIILLGIYVMKYIVNSNINVEVEANQQYEEAIENTDNKEMTTEEYNRRNREYLDKITEEREEFLRQTEGTDNPLLKSVRESYGK